MSEPEGKVLLIPAMANAHSHAFQRLLRGVAEGSAKRNPERLVTGNQSLDGDRHLELNSGVQPRATENFWTWREAMFSLTERFDPDRLFEVAKMTFKEMKAAGYGAVGEFHYLHHQPGGKPYADTNIMAKALAEAASEEELPVTLLPAAYHRGGWNYGDVEPSPLQKRFCDPDVHLFLQRVDTLREWAEGKHYVKVGVAAHSVRAVPASWLKAIAEYSESSGLVRHVHAHEQPREIEESKAEHGCTPIELLSRTGFLGERASIIHGIHVTATEIELLAESHSTVVTCPTTEGNLGDGYFPALEYVQAGVPLAIGSDSQVIIDPFQEVRELEIGVRRATQSRDALLAHSSDLWGDCCRSGYRSLGLFAETQAQIAIDLNHPTLTDIPLQNIPASLVTSASADVVTDLP